MLLDDEPTFTIAIPVLVPTPSRTAKVVALAAALEGNTDAWLNGNPTPKGLSNDWKDSVMPIGMLDVTRAHPDCKAGERPSVRMESSPSEARVAVCVDAVPRLVWSTKPLPFC